MRRGRATTLADREKTESVVVPASRGAFEGKPLKRPCLPFWSHPTWSIEVGFYTEYDIPF